MNCPDRKLRLVVMSGSETGCRYVELLNSMNEIDLVLAVTGQDRQRGRGRKMRKCYLADFCGRKGLKAYQTRDINSPESFKALETANADAAFVVDYGQILSSETLGIFPMGSYNIHYSILPEFRGASPVRMALMSGYKKTGVTLMKMNEVVDSGEIISSREVAVEELDNYATLKKRLTEEGLILTEEFFRNIARGILMPVRSQSGSGSYAPKIKGKCSIDWNKPAQHIVCLINSMSPNPGCLTGFEEKCMDIKILSARVSNALPLSPGEVCEVSRESFSVSASSGSVEILSLQPSGKRVMTAREFMAGNSVKKGEHFV